MAFTDSDVKRWKSFKGPKNKRAFQVWQVEIPELRALLARLDAAEKIALAAEALVLSLGTHEVDEYKIDQVNDALEFWREEAGKCL